MGASDSRPPFAVGQLDHVVLRVRDLEASIRFYAEVLGCEEERRLPDLGLVQLRAGQSLIDLVGVETPLGQAGGEAPARDAPNVDHFALRIDPFDADRIADHFEALGVHAGPVGERYGADGFGPSLYLKDPDGNTVEIKGPSVRTLDDALGSGSDSDADPR